MKFEFFYTKMEPDGIRLYRSYDTFCETDEGDILKRDGHGNWTSLPRKGEYLIWREGVDYLELY